MLNIAIIGASGYTGVELARLLSNHPEVRLTLVTSRQFEGQPLSQVFPNLRSKVDLLCENPDIGRLCDRADLYFTAVPHKTAMDLVPHLRRAGKKVVDLSAAYRIKDPAVYEMIQHADTLGVFQIGLASLLFAYGIRRVSAVQATRTECSGPSILSCQNSMETGAMRKPVQ